MVDRLFTLHAEGTVGVASEPMPVKSLRSPTAVLQGQPKKEFELCWRLHLLEISCTQELGLPVEHGHIGRARGIDARPAPTPDRAVRRGGV
jgi:hypothetical protein